MLGIKHSIYPPPPHTHKYTLERDYVLRIKPYFTTQEALSLQVGARNLNQGPCAHAHYKVLCAAAWLLVVRFFILSVSARFLIWRNVVRKEHFYQKYLRKVNVNDMWPWVILFVFIFFLYFFIN